MEHLLSWNYEQPVRISFGCGKIRTLAAEIKKLSCKRGLLVTSPSFVKRGLADEVIKESSGQIVALYGVVSPNPDVCECDACVALVKQHQCDFVVAIGGGSVMDCAKAVATISLTSHVASYFLSGGGTLPEQHLPLIAIPTTAGTGSEITCVSVLSDHEMGIKAPLSSAGFYPALALVDPELTYTVPPYLTACTGFDVLCHATEAYWSVHHQPICDALAVHAARLVLTYLEPACKDAGNILARNKMAEASVIAGLAFTQPKTTSSHACSYALTRLLDIPHGEACALTIDYFMRLNAAQGCDRVEDFAHLLGFDSAQLLADAYTHLKQRTGVRCDLKSYHLTDKQVADLVVASQHPNLRNNPVEITSEMLKVMYESMR